MVLFRFDSSWLKSWFVDSPWSSFVFYSYSLGETATHSLTKKKRREWKSIHAWDWFLETAYSFESTPNHHPLVVRIHTNTCLCFHSHSICTHENQLPVFPPNQTTIDSSNRIAFFLCFRLEKRIDDSAFHTHIPSSFLPLLVLPSFFIGFAPLSWSCCPFQLLINHDWLFFSSIAASTNWIDKYTRFYPYWGPQCYCNFGTN